MEESKRQKQVGALLLVELSDIFQRLGLSMIEGGMVSLTAVKLTPDLIEDRGWEIKRELAGRVKHQLRRIPVLQYIHDDTLDHADRMEALFRKIKEDRPPEEGHA
jgi:ribosome-binding factor A